MHVCVCVWWGFLCLRLTTCLDVCCLGMSVHVLECVWLNLHRLGVTVIDTHSSVWHTCSHHVTSSGVWFWHYSFMRGPQRQLYCMSGVNPLHYEVIKKHTTQKPSWVRVFAVYVYIMGLTASVSVCLYVCVRDCVSRKPRSNNSHDALTEAAVMPSADTPSRLRRRHSQLPPFPGKTAPDRSTATCQAFIIASLSCCKSVCVCVCVVWCGHAGEGVWCSHW